MFETMNLSKNIHWIQRKILSLLHFSPEAEQRTLHAPDPAMTSEEESKAELERLQALIDDRKRMARDTDLSYLLWGLYTSYFRDVNPPSLDHYINEGDWYDVKILKNSTRNGLNVFEFELKGRKYKFVDDEEKQGWRVHLKFFSLFLYDESDRCLIEIPMKMRIDKLGRDYSIQSDGPRAFLPGDWTKNFINVTLKHQSIRNQEIRLQKHQERLREIEDLKNRFGILD
jgi:hypothetical protein